MQSTTTTAPGKLLLMGDHAVVYDRPCLVTAVDQRMKVTARATDDDTLTLNGTDVSLKEYQKPIDRLTRGDIPQSARFVEYATRNFFQKNNIRSGLRITSQSDFSSKVGFGSSSAVTVATIKALSVLFALDMTHRQLFDLAYQTVIDIQKKGSGFDVASAVYGGTIYFVTGGAKIEPMDTNELPLMVGYTGKKADTVSLVTQVAKRRDKNPDQINGIFDEITKLVEQGRSALERDDIRALGKTFTKNQELLGKLGVSSFKLDTLTQATVDAGAYGAKLSGAGGGDCMIALAPDNKQEDIAQAIIQAGGTQISVTTDAQGVRVE